MKFQKFDIKCLNCESRDIIAWGRKADDYADANSGLVCNKCGNEESEW